MDSTTLREIGSQEEDSAIMNLSSMSLTLIQLLKKLAEGDLIQDKSLSFHASDGIQDKQKTFHIILKKIKWERVDAIAIILNDTTYQEDYFALKQANKNKDQIIATVSHELRTPLHGIIGLLEIVETKVNDYEVSDHLSLCKDNAHLLLNLVNSLLDLQQLSTGKLKLNQARINIKKTLHDVTQLFKFQCDKKSIFLDVEIQQDLSPIVLTDENRLKQILINIIGNAIKFTFKGGIKVEVTQDPEEWNHLVISVTDTGIGIKEEDIGKLFKMYGKLADGYGVNKNGVGLGLTISNTLASLLSGQNCEKGIHVTSQYEVGSRFSFRILKNLTSFDSSQTNHDNKKKALRSPQKKEQRQINCSFEAFLKSQEMGTPNHSSFVSLKESFEEICEENLMDSNLAAKMSSVLWRNRDSPSSLHKKSASEDSSFDISDKRTDRTAIPQLIKNSQFRSEQIMGKSTPVSQCILVVDDNPFNLLVAQSLLKDLGYEVKCASGGQEALNIVKDCNQEGMKIKSIFLDCQMPIMDGYETARILSSMMESGEISTVPILAWTANNSEQDIARCYESGMTGFLSKPTTRDNIMKILKK